MPETTEPQSLITLKAQLQQKRMGAYRRIMRWIWIMLYGGIIGIAALFMVINYSAIPSFRELEDPQSALASEVLANNGEVLGRYFIENRVPVEYKDLSPWLEKALVSTEDERFYQHCGIDWRAVARVMVRTVMLRDQSAGGGSTITQQLAKNLYSDRDFEGMNKVEKIFALLYRKLREWITAVKLEKSYTKQEIMAMYLNTVNFVNNAYGIRAASEVYFGSKPIQLKPEEAALLIGMLQNPSRYNPISRPDRAIRRRMTVLSQMRYAHHLTKPQYDSLRLMPIDMSRFRKVAFNEDKAPYLCAELKKDLAKILDAPECRRADGSKYSIYKDGLKIYTTIDPLYQKYAEASVQEHMRTLQRRFFTVWKGHDPWTYKTDETTDEEIAQRKEKFQSLLRQGDRYQALRAKILDPITEEIAKSIGYEPTDNDIVILLNEQKKPGTYSKMLSRNEITLQQAAAYRKILDGKYWTQLKSAWSSLQSATHKAFATKTRMKVFSWNSPNFERDTFMSPIDSLKYHRMFLQTGVLAVDPTNGEVKAWVGGNNFRYFQYDHVRSSRQVGSTFKPFIYATAMSQQGMDPCFQVYDMPVTIPKYYQNFKHGQDWTPKNATNTYSYKLITLREALKNSVNSVSAYLMKQMGSTEPVFAQLRNMGIDSTARLPNSPTICLGAGDLTVWQMTGAYDVFANNGVWVQPHVIREIRDKSGKVIYRAMPDEHLALSPQANDMINNMLQYNVKGAPGISQLKSQIGGKTGTTNDYTDGWFMGVTPKLVVGVWVGGEDRWIRFNTLADGQGARMARPIFAGFIKRLEQDNTSGYDAQARFKRPAGASDIHCEVIQDTAAPGGDEEFGGSDNYGDEPSAPPAGQPAPNAPAKPAPGKTPPANKPKRPDDGFGG